MEKAQVMVASQRGLDRIIKNGGIAAIRHGHFFVDCEATVVVYEDAEILASGGATIIAHDCARVIGDP